MFSGYEFGEDQIMRLEAQMYSENVNCNLKAYQIIPEDDYAAPDKG